MLIEKGGSPPSVKGVSADRSWCSTLRDRYPGARDILSQLHLVLYSCNTTTSRARHFVALATYPQVIHR